MLKKFFYLAAIAAFFIACKSEQAADTTQQTGQPQTFGAQITADGAISYADVLPKLAGVDSVKVKLKGTVQEVCQKKGCWMNVNDAQASQAMFVKFKDYAFFMPMDISGREVIMEGYAFREVTPVDELRHYAEDEGKSKEEIAAITEPKEELKFMADGVLLLPAPQQK